MNPHKYQKVFPRYYWMRIGLVILCTITNVFMIKYILSFRPKKVEDGVAVTPDNYGSVVDKLHSHIGNQIYLDYTGAGVYADTTVEDINELVKQPTIFKDRDRVIQSTKEKLLEFLGAPPDTYDVHFLASATQALKAVGEHFPWSEENQFIYTRYNHNSVLGIRKYAINNNSSFKVVDSPFDVRDNEKPGLMVFPLEDNFAGTKYPTEDIKRIISKYSGKYTIIGDTAAYLPTNRMNLTETPLDGIIMSFYKIFGFPNYGALVLKKSSRITGIRDDRVPIQSIIAVREGLKFMETIGIDNIQKHTWKMTRKLYTKLNELILSNGKHAAEIYGNHHLNDETKQGGIVAFNLMRTNGSYWGYAHVVSEASQSRFNLRGGCHCNPGACFTSMRISEDKVRNYFAAKTTCGDKFDIVDGIPLGAVRASVGWATREEDITKFVNWVDENFVF